LNNLMFVWIVGVSGAAIQEVMEVDECPFIVQEDDRVGRWFEIAYVEVATLQVQEALVVGSPNRGKRNPTPAAGDGAMNMAKKDVAYIRIAAKKIAKAVALHHGIAVEVLEADVERRMMHEDIDWPIHAAIEDILEPGRAISAIDA
jgi:hypothetical protein